MTAIINGIFNFLHVAFDKVPFLTNLKGYRSVVGFVGMGVIVALRLNGIGDPSLLDTINLGLMGFTGLSLNAKGR